MSNRRLFLKEFALFCAVIFVYFRPANGDRCITTDTCVCLGSGYEINLSQLTSSTAIPRFNHVTSNLTPNVSYSYNPCYGFRLGGDTTPGSCGHSGTAVCMTNGTQQVALGVQESAQFVFNATTLAYEIYYDTGNDSRRFTHLTLTCEPTLRPEQSSLTVENVINTSANERIFLMNLVSPCACPNGCLAVQQDDGDQGLSFGSVLVLLFCFGVLIYLCVGVAFLYFARGATGWELIPNYEFWMDFPLLIRDGVLFAISGCKPAVNYNRI